MSSTSVFRSALFAAALMTSAVASAQPPVKVSPPPDTDALLVMLEAALCATLAVTVMAG